MKQRSFLFIVSVCINNISYKMLIFSRLGNDWIAFIPSLFTLFYVIALSFKHIIDITRDTSAI